MPSLVIINLTNIILNVAICQVGPLYYQNKLLPGETTHRSLGHVFYTLEFKPWTPKNEYEDADVISKLAVAIFTLGGLLTPWEIPNYFKTVDNSNIPYWYLKHKNLPWMRKPGIHMIKDRTFIVEGGPEKSGVDLTLNKDLSVAKFAILNENKGLGQLRIREIPFEESHKYFYVSNEVKITHVKSTPILTET